MNERETPGNEYSATDVFVICPIGDRDAEHDSPARIAYEESIQVWEEVIVPACSVFGLKPERADRISRTGEITDQVFRLLRDCDLVIADLTGANPNVMYELGLRHTTGKLTIQLGERERLPFDISAIRTILFRRTEAGLVDARKRLAQSIATGLEDGGDFVAATRVFLGETVSDLGDAQAAELLLEEDDQPGFLELLADTEEGMEGLTPVLQSAAAITTEIGGLFSAAGSEAKASPQADLNARRRLGIANRLAGRLEDPAERLSVNAQEFRRTVARIDPGIRYVLDKLNEEPESAAEAQGFLESIRGLVAAAETTLPQIAGFRNTTLDIGKSARSLRRVAKRIADSLKIIISGSEKIVSWRNLMPEEPPD